MKKFNPIWFVDPNGDLASNKLIVDMFLEFSEENECRGKLCLDGVRRDLWRCDHLTVEKLRNANTQMDLKFKIFVQDSRNGKPRNWDFSEDRVDPTSGRKMEGVYSHD